MQRVTKLVAQKKLTVFPIGIGGDADMHVLARFSPVPTPTAAAGAQLQGVLRVAVEVRVPSVPVDTRATPSSST